jgi:hypothetical protein
MVLLEAMNGLGDIRTHSPGRQIVEVARIRPWVVMSVGERRVPFMRIGGEG